MDPQGLVDTPMFQILKNNLSSFFPYRTVWEYSDEDSLTGASKAGGV